MIDMILSRKCYIILTLLYSVQGAIYIITCFNNEWIHILFKE